MKFLARPNGRDVVCSVTKCALPINKYYKQCSLCVVLGFFDNLIKLNKIQINLRYVDAIHWLNQCNE
jgi:hypothetical protein